MLAHSTTTILSAALIGLSLTTATASPAAAAAGATTVNLETRVWRSNVDVSLACREQYGDKALVVRQDDSCGGWKCEINGDQRGLNMDLYCIRRFGSDAYAACGGGTVWDWQCHDRT